eukprot:680932-Prymnesium_polylepis.1
MLEIPTHSKRTMRTTRNLGPIHLLKKTSNIRRYGRAVSARPPRALCDGSGGSRLGESVTVPRQGRQ